MAAIDSACDAFEYVGTGPPEFERDVARDEEWRTQLTKACRYLASCRALRAKDGFNGAVVELCFSAIERTIEAYLLRHTADSLASYRDHETVYERAAEHGVFERETAERLARLYRRNRTEHYYGGLVPTQAKEAAMFELAGQVHSYVTGLLEDEPVCQCP
ncbi:hypothetical protein L593_06920 [Salinarchaeum sp. Harcht-Bsk1]|nr:hypothetical protein L593_06920 [Salinarchaeum sp. Harcht-Bsk1]